MAECDCPKCRLLTKLRSEGRLPSEEELEQMGAEQNDHWLRENPWLADDVTLVLKAFEIRALMACLQMAADRGIRDEHLVSAADKLAAAFIEVQQSETGWLEELPEDFHAEL